MMKATIATTMHTTADHMWQELQKVSSLMQIASPVLTFKPQQGQHLPATWQVGHNYALDLFGFYIVPLGKHYIHIKQIDGQRREMFTNEHGALTKIWNHRIRVESLNESAVHYTDEIEIDAGILTPLIWVFAQLFYRHRQRRWKKFLAH